MVSKRFDQIPPLPARLAPRVRFTAARALSETPKTVADEFGGVGLNGVARASGTISATGSRWQYDDRASDREVMEAHARLVR